MNVRQGFKRVYFVAVAIIELVLVIRPLVTIGLTAPTIEMRSKATQIAAMETVLLLIVAMVIWLVIDWIWRGFDKPNA